MEDILRMKIYEYPVRVDDENGKKVKKNLFLGSGVYKLELPEFYPDLPTKKYDVIYCDPPWDYGGKMQFDKSGKRY